MFVYSYKLYVYMIACISIQCSVCYLTEVSHPTKGRGFIDHLILYYILYVV